MLNLTNKMNLLKADKRVALSDLSIYFTLENIKKFSRNNKFKVSGTTWAEEFEMPDRSYSRPDIQGYFKNIIKKYETLVDKPPVQIYVNKIQTRVTCKI